MRLLIPKESKGVLHGDYGKVPGEINEEVRKKANDLGMVYATSEQIMGYESPSSDSVKQYESIPENGVLAQSDHTN